MTLTEAEEQLLARWIGMAMAVFIDDIHADARVVSHVLAQQMALDVSEFHDRRHEVPTFSE